MSRDPSASDSPRLDAYRGVLLAVLAASALGTAVVTALGLALGNPVVVDAGGALALATAILVAVAATRRRRRRGGDAGEAEAPGPAATAEDARSFNIWLDGPSWVARRLARPQGTIAAIGAVVLLAASAGEWARTSPSLSLAAAAAACAVVAAGLALTAANYLAVVDGARFPEAPGLARGARLLAWVLLLAASAVALAWAGADGAVRFLHALLLGLGGLVCAELFVAESQGTAPGFPTDLKVFSALGSRANPLASLHDAAQLQLGIDLRSTWALDIVRRSTEPLFVALLAIGWLSTALTVVGVDEVGLVERLGVPLAGPPTLPGLQLHWPWPIDRVVRIPVRRVATLHVGHEGEEEGGPEDVLWARQHGGTEYTLLLGDGRDLIAVDAAVQFRIADPRAWHYGSQNPADALRAIAYRAVMKVTVGRTLAGTLSENVASLTAQMRDMVQADADALGLGIEVVAFTIGGMHPPVSVAADYQGVVSAALRKTTAAIEAHAYRNERVPAAEAEVVASKNAALADGANALAKASGEAWGFRALESEYRAATDEYRFRRRLETLERGLEGRRFTVLDARIQRDGGELWLMQ